MGQTFMETYSEIFEKSTELFKRMLKIAQEDNEKLTTRLENLEKFCRQYHMESDIEDAENGEGAQ